MVRFWMHSVVRLTTHTSFTLAHSGFTGAAAVTACRVPLRASPGTEAGLAPTVMHSTALTWRAAYSLRWARTVGQVLYVTGCLSSRLTGALAGTFSAVKPAGAATVVAAGGAAAADAAMATIVPAATASAIVPATARGRHREVPEVMNGVLHLRAGTFRPHSGACPNSIWGSFRDRLRRRS